MNPLYQSLVICFRGGRFNYFRKVFKYLWSICLYFSQGSPQKITFFHCFILNIHIKYRGKPVIFSLAQKIRNNWSIFGIIFEDFKNRTNRDFPDNFSVFVTILIPEKRKVTQLFQKQSRLTQGECQGDLEFLFRPTFA